MQLPVYNYDQAQQLLTRRVDEFKAAQRIVRPIVDAVNVEGDAALLRFTQMFDGHQQLTVSEQQMQMAEQQLPDDVKTGIEQLAMRVRGHHLTQLERLRALSWMEENEQLRHGQRYTPIRSAGLYVPGGKGVFPSVALMLAIPAQLADVEQVVLCTPGSSEVNPAVLYAAQLAGVQRVFSVSGAQAIAALAYGTETIPKVEKIFGPGSAYVTAAKSIVWGAVDPGPYTSASESLILADASADEKLLAVEMLVEAEHGADSAVVVVTTDPLLPDRLLPVLQQKFELLPSIRQQFCRASIRNGGIIVCSTQQAIDFCNNYAPEHLRLLMEQDIEHQLVNAGEILTGPLTSIGLANFAIGVNSVLPTNRGALGQSALGVLDFMKATSVAELKSLDGIDLQAAQALAQWESFPAHAQAIEYLESDDD